MHSRDEKGGEKEEEEEEEGGEDEEELGKRVKKRKLRKKGKERGARVRVGVRRRREIEKQYLRGLNRLLT